ncbi:WXG100 family type VII secretion target [Bacillus mycoides]|uniref:WXG100 family type VII secretion target n=1 Tax=Bacillus mycoides TaxID=1405 RepID=UPI003463FB2D
MVQIKVTPEMLEEVANRANNTRIALETIHNNLCNEIDHLCFQWIGASNQQFIQMFNDARPKAFTSINSIIKVEEDLKRIAEKFRTADASYDGNLEEGAMCGKLNSEKNDGSLRDKVWHGLKETYEDLSKVKNSDESLYDKFKHGIDAAYKDVNKIKDTIDDEIESAFEKAGLGVPYHLKKGMGDAIGDELLGLADAVIHPIDTFNNTIEAVSHPVETFNAIKQTISDSWNRDVTNGDSYSGAEWYGSAAGHTILAVGQLFVGTKGVDKIAMLNPGTKLAEISRTANQSLQDAASLFNRNRNEFALAGGNNIRSVFDTPDFRAAEEKLSTLQFASREGASSGNTPYKFDSSLMEHVFHGEVRQKWWGLKAVGYHHENMMGGEIIRVTRPPNPAGVYVAEVKVDGIVKQAKSSFFPKDWNRVQVVDSIKEAYTNRVQIAPNKYVGQTSSGFKVEMIIENGEITTAYPKYTRR